MKSALYAVVLKTPQGFKFEPPAHGLGEGRNHPDREDPHW